LIQRLASLLILAAPLPLIVSFFVDPGNGVRSSPWMVFTMRGLFLAAVLLALSHRPRAQFERLRVRCLQSGFESLVVITGKPQIEQVGGNLNSLLRNADYTSTESRERLANA
jgi:hypothetical protein